MPPRPHDAAPPDAPLAIDDLLERVRGAGARVTTARRAVLEVLLEAGTEHLSAEEVATRIQRTNPQIHLSTVYRTLESLEAMGVLRQAPLGAGPVSYHLHADVHHHAQCTTCGAVIHLPASVLSPVVRSLRRNHGFRAEPEHLTIPGTCATCGTDAAERR